MKIHRFVLALSALTALLALCLATVRAADVGQPVPDVDLPGSSVGAKLSELRGKVVYLDFWASWCGPCKESFPVMNDLQKKYADKGLVILAVNVDEKAEAMKDFLKQNPASFTIVHDATKKLVGTASISSMPTSFVLGKDGKVVAIHKGFHGKDTVKQYEAEIEKLLSTEVAAAK